MNAVWGTLLGVAITALCGLIGKLYADRGKGAVDLNGMAMGMVTALTTRVERLEAVESWRQVVEVVKDDYIDSLRQHITDGHPPPPPVRPIYPPRPPL